MQKDTTAGQEAKNIASVILSKDRVDDSLHATRAAVEGAVIAGKVLDRDEYNWGFDAQTGEFKDLVKAGIIDPTKVVRTALQDAASVAGLLARSRRRRARRCHRVAAVWAAWAIWTSESRSERYGWKGRAAGSAPFHCASGGLG